MGEQTYGPARIVAERIQSRLATEEAPRPSVAAFEEIISAAFWASLRREEGRSPKISLAYISPEEVKGPLRFASPLPLEPNVLVRLAPAVERPGIHLGVSTFGGQLRVWGTTRMLPSSCLVFEVNAPGLLVVKIRRDEASTKFTNIVVLNGAEVKFIAQHDSMVNGYPPTLRSLLTFYTSGGLDEPDSLLVRLALSMRAHAHGGTLLVVPSGSEEWLESMVRPIPYSVSPPFSAIDGLPNDSNVWRTAIDLLAGWTAVDGATVISDRFALLASGVKIVSRDASRRVREVMVTEPTEDSEPLTVEPSQLGNTRHLSAAQFVYDQHDAVALVSSQDGRFTVFGWSTSENIVHAHRLESLLL
jgi:hypothetical protein